MTYEESTNFLGQQVARDSKPEQVYVPPDIDPRYVWGSPQFDPAYGYSNPGLNTRSGVQYTGIPQQTTSMSTYPNPTPTPTPQQSYVPASSYTEEEWNKWVEGI